MRIISIVKNMSTIIAYTLLDNNKEKRVSYHSLPRSGIEIDNAIIKGDLIQIVNESTIPIIQLDTVMDNYNRKAAVLTGINNSMEYKITGIELILIKARKEMTSAIKIPYGVTVIGAHAFNGCSSINSIELPKSIRKLVDCCFYGCSSLNSINIPDGLEEIGIYAFYSCIAIRSIEIPDSVTNIGHHTFCQCTRLERISIPKHMSIPEGCFEGCTNVEITRRE